MLSGIISTHEVLALRSCALLAGLDLELGNVSHKGGFQLFHIISADPNRVKKALAPLKTVLYGKAKPPKEIRNTIVGRKPQAHGQYGE